MYKIICEENIMFLDESSLMGILEVDDVQRAVKKLTDDGFVVEKI